MRGTFLDTNIFLRHLLNDHADHGARALRLFQAIERRELTGWTSGLVVAEIVFVLSSPRIYGVPREDIRDHLVPLLTLPGIQLEHKRLYHRVFDLFTSLPIDYIDCYHAVLVASYRQNTLYSFDTDFDAVPGLTRQEP
jgi:predicted nucleic acid-binding protein